MKKVTLLLTLLLAFSTPGVAAQDAETPTRVYVSYFQVGYGDLLEWLDLYQEHWAPLLDEAVEEGAIMGHGAQTHNTGGIYNFRLSMRGNQDTNFDRANEAILGRWMERHPESFTRALEMMRSHEDDIWNIDQMSITEGADWQFMYDNLVQLPYSEWLGYTQVWNDAMGELLEEARADGVLAGYVIESHNTGGAPFNWKILFLFPDWNSIHELQARMLGAVPMDHPMWANWLSHKDELWERLPPAGN